jgi:hypothetical protein
MKFYPRDWRGDQALRAVNMAARGLWMECLCIMHEAKPYGHLLINGEVVEDDVLARMVGAPVDEVRTLVSELRKAGVLSMTRSGVIFSRRMVKDHAKAQKGAKAAHKRWAQASEIEEESSAPNGLPNRNPITQKPEARNQKNNIRVFEAPREPRKPEREELFDRFRLAYPKRDGTQDWPKAREVFGRMVKSGTDPEAIIGGAQRYAADCRRRGVEGGQYVKQARTWLNGRLWEEYGGAPSPEAPAIDWRGLVGRYAGGGSWPSGAGPAPDFGGCRAPPELLIEYGFAQPAGAAAGGAP